MRSGERAVRGVCGPGSARSGEVYGPGSVRSGEMYGVCSPGRCTGCAVRGASEVQGAGRGAVKVQDADLRRSVRKSPMSSLARQW